MKWDQLKLPQREDVGEMNGEKDEKVRGAFGKCYISLPIFRGFKREVSFSVDMSLTRMQVNTGHCSVTGLGPSRP